MNEDNNVKSASNETLWGHLLTIIEGLVRAHSHVADVVPAVGAASVAALRADAATLRNMISPPPPPVEHDPETNVPAPGQSVDDKPAVQPPPEPIESADNPADHSAESLNAEELDRIESQGDRKASEYAKAEGEKD